MGINDQILLLLIGAAIGLVAALIGAFVEHKLAEKRFQKEAKLARQKEQRDRLFNIVRHLPPDTIRELLESSEWDLTERQTMLLYIYEKEQINSRGQEGEE